MFKIYLYFNYGSYLLILLNKIWSGRTILNRDPNIFRFSFLSDFKNIVFFSKDLGSVGYLKSLMQSWFSYFSFWSVWIRKLGTGLYSE